MLEDIHDVDAKRASTVELPHSPVLGRRTGKHSSSQEPTMSHPSVSTMHGIAFIALDDCPDLDTCGDLGEGYIHELWIA